MSQQNEITLEPKSSGESACNESGQYQEQKNTAETTENHKVRHFTLLVRIETIDI